MGVSRRPGAPLLVLTYAFRPDTRCAWRFGSSQSVPAQRAAKIRGWRTPKCSHLSLASPAGTPKCSHLYQGRNDLLPKRLTCRGRSSLATARVRRHSRAGTPKSSHLCRLRLPAQPYVRRGSARRTPTKAHLYSHFFSPLKLVRACRDAGYRATPKETHLWLLPRRLTRHSHPGSPCWPKHSQEFSPVTPKDAHLSGRKPLIQGGISRR